MTEWNSETDAPAEGPNTTTAPGGWRGLLRGESGQTLVIAAACMAMICVFLGLSIDVGQARYQKRRLQTAADAAAVQNSLTENGFTGVSLLTQCASNTSTSLVATVNNGPCAVPTDPNKGNTSYVEVVLSYPQPTVFSKIMGITSIPVAARGEAAPSGPGNCIYALDPSGSSALSVDFFASLSASCGIVVESSSYSALGCFLASIRAPQITVTGSYSSFACSISPTPTTRAAVPSPADPLAYLPTPTVPACGTSTRSPYYGSSAPLTITGTAVLYANGAYCGGITIKPGANVTFNPGIYALTSQRNGANLGSGGLTVDVGSTVNGNGVMFYNSGPSGGIAFNYTSFSYGGVNLVAPTSGTYGGILFYQDRRNSSQATIVGSSGWNTVLQGTYYFPSAKVVFAFDGSVDYNILVAYDIEFAFLTSANVGTSNFTSNYTSLVNGSPLSGTGAVVVQ
jgi:Flp pilus assembly protein TadG